MAEIIPFPKENIRLPFNKIIEELNISNDTGLHLASTTIDTTNMLMCLLLENMQHLGIDTKTSEHDSMCDLALLLESLKSFIFSYYDLYYPLQNVSKGLFNIKDNIIYLNQKKINQLFNDE